MSLSLLRPLLALSLVSSLTLGAGPPAIGFRSGQMHPDFVLPDLEGKLHRLSDYRGKKVFLFHFASW